MSVLSFCSKTQACYRCTQWWCHILVTPPQQSSDNPETTVQYEVWNMASHHCNGRTSQWANDQIDRTFQLTKLWFANVTTGKSVGRSRKHLTIYTAHLLDYLAIIWRNWRRSKKHNWCNLLVACTRLYTPLCRSVRPSVGPSDTLYFFVI